MSVIQGSVGKWGVNNKADVELVQTRLNYHLTSDKVKKLVVDGYTGPNTEGRIGAFQKAVVKITPDHRVDVGGNTIRLLMEDRQEQSPEDETEKDSGGDSGKEEKLASKVVLGVGICGVSGKLTEEDVEIARDTGKALPEKLEIGDIKFKGVGTSLDSDVKNISRRGKDKENPLNLKGVTRSINKVDKPLTLEFIVSADRHHFRYQDWDLMSPKIRTLLIKEAEILKRNCYTTSWSNQVTRNDRGDVEVLIEKSSLVYGQIRARFKNFVKDRFRNGKNKIKIPDEPDLNKFADITAEIGNRIKILKRPGGGTYEVLYDSGIALTTLKIQYEELVKELYYYRDFLDDAIGASADSLDFVSSTSFGLLDFCGSQVQKFNPIMGAKYRLGFLGLKVTSDATGELVAVYTIDDGAEKDFWYLAGKVLRALFISFRKNAPPILASLLVSQITKGKLFKSVPEGRCQKFAEKTIEGLVVFLCEIVFIEVQEKIDQTQGKTVNPKKSADAYESAVHALCTAIASGIVETIFNLDEISSVKDQIAQGLVNATVTVLAGEYKQIKKILDAKDRKKATDELIDTIPDVLVKLVTAVSIEIVKVKVVAPTATMDVVDRPHKYIKSGNEKINQPNEVQENQLVFDQAGEVPTEILAVKQKTLENLGKKQNEPAYEKSLEFSAEPGPTKTEMMAVKQKSSQYKKSTDSNLREIVAKSKSKSGFQLPSEMPDIVKD